MLLINSGFLQSSPFANLNVKKMKIRSFATPSCCNREYISPKNCLHCVVCRETPKSPEQIADGSDWPRNPSPFHCGAGWNSSGLSRVAEKVLCRRANLPLRPNDKCVVCFSTNYAVSAKRNGPRSKNFQVQIFVSATCTFCRKTGECQKRERKKPSWFVAVSEDSETERKIVFH